MISGIQLSLLIGPIVPIPAPRVVIDALDSVTVTTAAGETSGFQMSLAIDSRSQLNTLFLIAGGQSSTPATPPLRVTMVITMNATPTVLFDGVMTRIEVQPGQSGARGSITVTGEDISRVMDNIDFSGLPYPAMPVPARVALICAKYAMFGLVPVVIPPIFLDVPIPIERIPGHQGTDLQYLRQMASEAGYVFYVEPGPTPGMNVAYFGPEIKVGVPQPALNIDMDAHTNVESMNFSFDPTKGVLPIVFIQNQATRAPIPIPIPNLNPLQPPLGVLPTPLSNIRMMKDTAKLDPLRAIGRGVAEAAKSQDSVTASGSLSVLRYGRLLKARQLVGVRGAGLAYNGLYYVKKVTSTLKRGEFRQRFELTRNGLISIVSSVPA